MEKDFWWRITCDEIITDYNTKAVNVDAYQRRDKAIFKTRNGKSGNGNGEQGTENGERGIYKMGNLEKRESLK